MPPATSEPRQHHLDESLQALRTAVLCRLARRLGWTVDEHHVRALVQRSADTEVWHTIEQSQASSLQHFFRLFSWRSRHS